MHSETGTWLPYIVPGKVWHLWQEWVGKPGKSMFMQGSLGPDHDQTLARP